MFMQNSRGSAFKKCNSPNKITTMRTKCWLTQEGCHKLVTIHLMNTSSHRTTTTIHEGLFLVCATMRHLILSTFYKFIYKNIKIMTGRKKIVFYLVTIANQFSHANDPKALNQPKNQSDLVDCARPNPQMLMLHWH